MANDSKNITIVIPTYNETENIASISREIFQCLPAVKIIFVDDDSQDGTEKIANSLVRADSRVKFISRKGKIRSFSQSYIEGFKAAFADGADYIIQMDADFSHNPKYLPQIIENLGNYDIVIGSRYIKGGKVENWSLIRRLISRGGSVYTQIIAGLPLSDPTAGFVGWKRESLQKINLDEIRSNGYGFQIEMKFNAYKNNFKIKEIPITFTDRKHGASKMRKRIILEAALFCWKLRLIK
ncbi:polyprenol monophosphomannose synthase [Patescibacteria group bacterium]|nr:polyprenol monophosphomannose synthase [Patescibacteria group bacterium]MBU4579757.1 polyprenol monophosphomannose synthase [Patescibacteria group bacterium]